METYEDIWNDLKQRLQLARMYSLRMDITYDHIIGLMQSYEEALHTPPEPEEGNVKEDDNVGG